MLILKITFIKKRMSRMRVVDLFSGCGGMSLGFEKAGFDVVAACEHWEAASRCYEANFDHPVLRIDLSDVETASREIAWFHPDVIIGGPPCQDYSSAGKRVEGDKAALTECYARIVSNVSPVYFVMENVAGALKSDSYKKARRIFKNSRYGLTETVLDASLCGVPQKRKRLFVFGMIGKEDGFALERFASCLSNKPMTLRDCFGDFLGFEYYYNHPRNYKRRGIFSVDEPAPTMRGIQRPMPAGYPGHKNDSCDKSQDIHALTSRERALIQTFPRDFKLVGSKAEVEQMIGNAVPVNLAKYVAEVVKSYIVQ